MNGTKMNGTEMNEIENIKKTLWFSFKEESVDSLNDRISGLSSHDKMKIEEFFSKKINNLIGSIIGYANSRNNGGRSAVVATKRELSCLMQLNLTISYGTEHMPILVDSGIVNNDGIQKFIKEAYESERCISYCK